MTQTTTSNLTERVRSVVERDINFLVSIGVTDKENVELVSERIRSKILGDSARTRADRLLAEIRHEEPRTYENASKIRAYCIAVDTLADIALQGQSECAAAAKELLPYLVKGIDQMEW